MTRNKRSFYHNGGNYGGGSGDRGGSVVEYSDAFYLGVHRCHGSSLPSPSPLSNENVVDRRKILIPTPCNNKNKRRKFELPSFRFQIMIPDSSNVQQPYEWSSSWSSNSNITTEKIPTTTRSLKAANAISAVSNAVDEEATLNTTTTTTTRSCDDKSGGGASHNNNNNRILEMLSKLKMVDYWKFLPAESWWQSKYNKENESEDDDDDDDEEDHHDELHHPFCCCVVSGGSPERQDGNVRMLSTNIEISDEDAGAGAGATTKTTDCGFVIEEVTDEGWICAACSPSSITLFSSPHAENEQEQGTCEQQQQQQQQQQQGRYLLRLPVKVAKSATPGMKIVGIDLWERLNNGAIEPCFGGAEVLVRF